MLSALLARPARPPGVFKEPPPVQPSLVESFKRMDVQAAEGKTTSRAVIEKATREHELAGPKAAESVPVPAPHPAPTSSSSTTPAPIFRGPQFAPEALVSEANRIVFDCNH